MPRVTLFQMVKTGENYYGGDFFEASTPIGAEIVEITDNELNLLEKYLKENGNKGFILATEENQKIPIAISEMIKEAEKWKKKNQEYLKKVEEEKIKKEKAKLEREMKKFEELKKKFEG